MTTIFNKKGILFVCIFLLLSSFARTQELTLEEFEITNKPIQAIIGVFSEIYGITIVVDETVVGNASHNFVNIDFETAIEVFLKQNDLYLTVDDANIYYVSKIYISKDENSALTIKAKEVDTEYLIGAIAEYTNNTILVDNIPTTNTTIYVEAQPIFSVLEIIVADLGTNYALLQNNNYFHIEEQSRNSRGNTRSPIITRDGEKYSIKVTNTPLREVLQALFLRADKEYILLLNNNSTVEDVSFAGKSFDQLLTLILAKFNATYSIREDEIYYLYESKNTQLIQEERIVRKYEIKHMLVESLVQAIPRDYLSSAQYSIDNDTNVLTYIGTAQEIEAIENIIATLDKEGENAMFRIDLRNLALDNAKELISTRFPSVAIQEVTLSNSIVVNTDVETYRAIIAYITDIESSTVTKLITLRYVQAADVFDYLPKHISSDELIATSEPTILFFTGNIERYNEISKEISLLDIPVAQIKYQILVIQNNASVDFGLNLGASNSYATPSSTTAILGSFSNVLSLSFDLLSTFGMVFSAKLSSSLQSGKSKVFIDTVLRSISGNKVEFSSDSTYRYQEIEIGTSSNITTNRGVTREITSGFTISIEGWVSGDNYVTMNIATNLSSLGVAANSTNPPPSFEKKLLTNVKTLAGEPVVIGGLYQDEREIGQGLTNILGFTTSNKRIEYRVYIVPIIEQIYGNSNYHRTTETLYKKYVSK